MKDQNRLFFICPDCYNENYIRQNYGVNSFFLTALGAVFDFEDEEFISEIENFIQYGNISEIIFVNDLNCTFLKNVVNNVNGVTYKAERILEDIISSSVEISLSDSYDEKLYKLIELNIKKSVYDFTESSLFHKKLSDKDILIKGLIMNKRTKFFHEFSLKYKRTF